MNMKLSEALRKGAEMINWRQCFGNMFTWHIIKEKVNINSACAIGCIALGMGRSPEQQGPGWWGWSMEDCVPNENMRHLLMYRNDIARDSLEEILHLLELMESEDEISTKEVSC